MEQQYYTNHEICVAPNYVSMSLEDVFGSIKLAEPGKDLDQIIEESKEEHVERF
jgi:hypothetical protein